MKRVFIGSSTESLNVARAIASVIRSDPSLDCQILEWTEAFPASTFTLEANERSAASIDGALLIASPDDTAYLRSTIIQVPRTNVMLEMGFFMGSLGRNRVALCQFDETILPSDLKGLTPIRLGSYSNFSTDNLKGVDITPLKTWIASLPSLIKGCAATMRVSGYSGVWEVRAPSDCWVGKQIEAPDFVEFRGEWHLHIPDSGVAGTGVSVGHVFAHVGGTEATIAVCEKITGVKCNQRGGMVATLEFHSRVILDLKGNAELARGFSNDIPGPKTQRWILEPCSQNRDSLVGYSEDMLDSRFRRSQRIIAWRTS